MRIGEILFLLATLVTLGAIVAMVPAAVITYVRHRQQRRVEARVEQVGTNRARDAQPHLN